MATSPSPQQPIGEAHVISPPGLIHKKICDVMRDIDAIGKTRRNTQGAGYNFRGIDDIYNALSSELATANLCIIPRVLTRECVERMSGNQRARLSAGKSQSARLRRIERSFMLAPSAASRPPRKTDNT